METLDTVTYNDVLPGQKKLMVHLSCWIDLDNSLVVVAIVGDTQALSINYFNTLFCNLVPVENLLIIQSNTSFK